MRENIADLASEHLGSELAGAMVADQIIAQATDENIELVIDHVDDLVEQIHVNCGLNDEGICQCSGKVVNEYICESEIDDLLNEASE